jgi:hypothetical protein
VWRVLFALRAHRPDLRIRYLNCPPTGLVAIDRLDPNSTILTKKYDAIIEFMMGLDPDEERLLELWALYPTLDTSLLAANPSDVSAVLKGP